MREASRLRGAGAFVRYGGTAPRGDSGGFSHTDVGALPDRCFAGVQARMGLERAPGEPQRPLPASLLGIMTRRLSQRCCRLIEFEPRALKMLRREGIVGVRKRLAARTRRHGRLRASASARNPFRRMRRIVLPASHAPEVSIIIPARDQWRFTHACLASIASHTSGAAYEVIPVDNASSDRTRHVERFTSGLRVVRHHENRGFVEACNAGAKAARGGKLVFLNNDVTVTARWLEPLLAVTRTRPSWGAVGTKLLFPNPDEPEPKRVT